MTDIIRLVEREQHMLRAHAPEIIDRAKEFYPALVRAGREYGFSELDINGIYDHRIIMLFKDAMIHLKLWKEVAE